MIILGSDLVLDYPIIDADAHVNEPPELWQERVPKRLRERAPKVIRLANGGDAWSFEDGARVEPVGLTATAGLDHIMWSTDYPHTGSDWPNSRVTLERNFRGLPYAEVKKMTHDTAGELYRISVPVPATP
jgi:hypothetical protein